ncbi:MAG: hypothetical protein ACI3Z0_01635 [Candidatus Cryptobacteroides sp.]
MKMKRITTMILSVAALSAAWNSNGQTVWDALRFSDQNYYGTARSIAMGNAFTALGGDLGSVNINPAGSAVNSFSQVTITPGLTISGSRASYLAEPSANDKYGPAYKNSSTKFTLPNVGVMINYNTRRKSGLKNVTFGFVANGTSSYLDNTAAAGKNGATTFAGSMAVRAGGLPVSGLDSGDAYSYYDWLSVVGLQSGMIAAYGGKSDEYAGVTESIYDSGSGNYDIQLSDVIDQRYGRISSGSKYDMVFNLGFNVSDRFFIGANLGVISLDYKMDEYFKEAALDPYNFGISFDGGRTGYFDNLRYRYSYDAVGSGVYGKFGVIFVPVPGLRIGAAIQTPTSTIIKEHWQHAGDTYFTDSYFNASAQSPVGEYKYKLVSPYRVNVGAAFTFGSFGLISADYEMCDYSTMKFKEAETNDHSAFEATNEDISRLTGISHMLRLGAEIKPANGFSVRAGYNLTTTGERYISDLGSKKRPGKSSRNSVSAGLGYSSSGSFFADLAVRGNFLAREYIYPYEDYIFDGAGNATSLTPEILNKRSLWDVVLTIGFRF